MRDRNLKTFLAKTIGTFTSQQHQDLIFGDSSSSVYTVKTTADPITSLILIEMDRLKGFKRSRPIYQAEDSIETSDQVSIRTFNGFYFNGNRFRMSKPVVYTITYNSEENDYWVECEDFGIFLPCETQSEIETSLQEQFQILWGEYVEEDESGLTGDAKELRRRLKDTFFCDSLQLSFAASIPRVDLF